MNEVEVVVGRGMGRWGDGENKEVGSSVITEVGDGWVGGGGGGEMDLSMLSRTHNTQFMGRRKHAEALHHHQENRNADVKH